MKLNYIIELYLKLKKSLKYNFKINELKYYELCAIIFLIYMALLILIIIVYSSTLYYNNI